MKVALPTPSLQRAKTTIPTVRMASTMAGADERSKARLAFVASTHRMIVTRVLKTFLEATAPDALPRFANPELVQRPNQKRGTQEYCANTSLIDYSLSVTLIDGDPMVLNVSLTIRNPYSDKRAVMIDASTTEELDGAFLTEKAKGTASKAAKNVVAEIRTRVAEDLPQLKVALQSAAGQVKFLKSLLSSFTADVGSAAPAPAPSKQAPPTTGSKEKRK